MMKFFMSFPILLVLGMTSQTQAQTSQTRSELQTLNDSEITTNGNGAITGSVLNGVLADIIASEATLQDNQTLSGIQTFQSGLVELANPFLNACTGYLYGNSTNVSSCSTTILATASNSSPNSVNSFGIVSSGNSGGGLGLIDGTYDWGIYDQSGIFTVGYGTSGGTLTPELSLTSSGNLSTATVSAQLIEALPLSPNPNSGIASFGIITYGIKGGGIGINENNTNNWGIYDQSGELYFGYVTGPPTSPLTSQMTISHNVNGAIISALQQNLTGPGGTVGTNYVDTTNGGNDYPVVFIKNNSTVGSITITNSATSFNTSSDHRLKENIVDSQEGLATLLRIPVEDFNFKNTPGETVQGFIAQDLYPIYPEAVTVGGENPQTHPWTVDYGRITPLLVKSIQDMQREIVDLKHEIHTLKRKKR
jgi:hypothetical protein